jgi:hypothetical protein
VLPQTQEPGVQPIGITDGREIAFDSEALIDVIAGSFERARVIGLPALKPAGVDFRPQQREIIFLYGENHPMITVTADHLGVLLVSYCVKAHIPLPRLPDKVIRVEPSAIILAFNSLYAKAPSW